ncbi:hypothetical protein FB451DRAFT_1197854 [Mycena latifolia]|nr:hypothetical protein FB451DRAFT_1197854 [Mycena latifolia]
MKMEKIWMVNKRAQASSERRMSLSCAFGASPLEITLVVALAYLILNKWDWLGHLGRMRHSRKNEKLENFLAELQCLTIHHERGQGGDDYYRLGGSKTQKDDDSEHKSKEASAKNKEGRAKDGKSGGANDGLRTENSQGSTDQQQSWSQCSFNIREHAEQWDLQNNDGGHFDSRLLDPQHQEKEQRCFQTARAYANGEQEDPQIRLRESSTIPRSRRRLRKRPAVPVGD